jgi:hypothetical protein
MNTFKLMLLAAAVVVGIPVASALTAHQFGSDSLGGRLAAPAPANSKRMDLDTLCIVNDSAPAHVNRFKIGDTFRPRQG